MLAVLLAALLLAPRTALSQPTAVVGALRVVDARTELPVNKFGVMSVCPDPGDGMFIPDYRPGPPHLLNSWIGCRIYVSSAGYRTGAIVVTKEMARSGFEVKLGGARLEGSVVSKGKGVNGAAIAIFPKGAKKRSPEADLGIAFEVSDEKGKFAISGLEPGAYEIIVSFETDSDEAAEARPRRKLVLARGKPVPLIIDADRPGVALEATLQE